EQASEFASLLLQEFKPKTERAREAVETAVRTLAEQALAQTDLVSNDAIKSIESIIAAIDAKLTAQVNQVIHHPEFQKQQSVWRGLHYLPNNTESDGQLTIRLLNIS
ncbi:type VI secretion system contractile sheath large subunit, partial [Pseudomonas frederiksbergensis]|nr:type VI secretion system contractile sheath large subunit [Pseudomonas frederiksbergensis]